MKAKRSAQILLSTCIAFLALPLAMAAGGIVEFAGESGGYEYEGRFSIEVRRTGDLGSTATVHFSTVDGSAKAGVDYEAVRSVLSFAPGESVKIIAVPILENGRLDGERMFDVRLTSPSGVALGSRDTASQRIFDNEMPVMVDSSFQPQIDGSVSRAVVQPDGRILISGDFVRVGCETRLGLARLLPDGSLDPGFRPPQHLQFVTHPLALRSDGKVHAFTRQGLVRLNADGSLDPSFSMYSTGGGESISVSLEGKVILTDGYLARALLPDGSEDIVLRDRLERVVNDQTASDWSSEVRSLVFQPDGKILIGFGGTSRSRVLRLHADGSRDQTFEASVSTSRSESDTVVSAIFPQNDGSLYIAGSFERVNGVARLHPLARLNPDGTLDTSFDAQSPFGQGSAQAGTVQPDGKVLMSFYLGFRSTPLMRFNRDGSLDGTFRSYSGYFCLALQPDGNLLLNSATGPRRVYGETRHRQSCLIDRVSDLLDASPITVTDTVAHVEISRLGETRGSESVTLRTRDGTARAGVDYVAVEERLTFAPLETSKAVKIRILRSRPSDFFVTLSEPSFAAAASWKMEQHYLLGRSAGVLSVSNPRCDPHRRVIRMNSQMPGPVIWEASTDLQNWLPVHVSTESSSILEFEDADAAGHPRRFYRARRNP